MSDKHMIYTIKLIMTHPAGIKAAKHQRIMHNNNLGQRGNY